MKNIALVCLLLLIGSTYPRMWINPVSEIRFGPYDVSLYGGIKVDLSKQTKGGDNKAAGIYFEPTSKIDFIGSEDDSLINVSTLNNVTLNKKGGNILIAQNLAIQGIIEFIQGSIVAAADTLILSGASSQVSGESETGMIQGNLKVSRYIGTGTSAATGHFGGAGFSINNTGNDIGTVTLHRKTGDGSQVTIMDSEGIKRQWKIETSVPFSGTRNVTAEWLGIEDNGNRLDHLRVWKYSGTWDSLATADYVTISDPRTATFNIEAAAKYTINNTDTYFAGGKGTETEPYLIRTAQHLDSLRHYLGAEWDGCFFKQIADINLGVAPWNTGSGWDPIGDQNNLFMGNYNGNGYSINGLTINRPAENYTGLFGNISDTYLRKIIVTGANVTGADYTGIVTGSADQYNYLDSCFVAGSVIGQNSAGGIAGQILLSTSLSKCRSEGSVQGQLYTGGLAGYTDHSYLNYCYSKSTVSGNSDAGGLIGYDYGSYINDNYAYGNVSGSNNAGGFLGNAYNSNIGSCYSTGSVTCSGNKGGFIGFSTAVSVTNSYWNTETSGLLYSSGGEGRTTDEMTFENSANTYVGWDFGSEYLIWEINYNINGGYPYFKWQNIPNTNFAGGSGTELDPYLVSNAVQLNNVRYYRTKAFRQTADIDLGVAPWNEGTGWNPISTDWMAPFRGKYDGDYHFINNLTMERDSMFFNYTGLFGMARNATIKELQIYGAQVTGYSNTGILLGYCDSLTVENCSVSGSVTANSYTGGIAGNMNNSSVSRCYSETDITSPWEWSYAGSFTGYISGSTITDSYSSGSVSGGNYIGGMIGYNYQTNISSSYSIGAVSGSGANVGGFIGCYDSGNVNECYWDTETSGQISSGAGYGRTTDDMTFEHNEATTYIGWDFSLTPVWEINYGINGGYPYLKWQNLPNTNFAGGTGIATDPYLVSNAEQLNKVRYYRTKYFRQTADIDLGVAPWNQGDGWAPIGNDDTNQFSGSYEGDFHKISNMVVARDSTMYNGLFGNVSNAVIKEIQVENASVTGWYQAGVIAGVCYSSMIDKCSVSGEINGKGSIGGIAGYVYDSKINSCYSETFVNCPDGDNVGGISGFTYYLSEINNCYSSGAVSGNSNAGGLTGYNWQSTVFNCYSTGAVSGTISTGGLIGNNSSGVTTCSYWNTQTSGQTLSAGGEGKTTDDMTYPFEVNTYLNWDFAFTPIWSCHESLNSGYPYLAWEQRTSVEAPSNVTIAYSAGNVTISWSAVTGAAGYKVYSSLTPYGTFTLDTSGIFNGTQWTASASVIKKFYYVTAINSTKIITKEPDSVR